MIAFDQQSGDVGGFEPRCLHHQTPLLFLLRGLRTDFHDGFIVLTRMAVAHNYVEVRASIDEWFEHLSKGLWATVYLTSPQSNFPDGHRLLPQGVDHLRHIRF